MRIHRGVAMPGKMLGTGEHSPAPQPTMKRGPHSGNEIGSRAEASILCHRAFRIGVQVQHRSEIEIASDGAQFCRNRAADMLRGIEVSQSSQFRSRRPRRERLTKGETLPAFLIDSDQYRAPGGLADCGGKFLKLVCAREIALVKNHSGEPAREIFRKFAGKRIAAEAQHKSFKYGISRLRIGVGHYIHLV